MLTRTRLATAAVAAVAFAAVPAVASAATPQLRGVVSGSPYGASGGTMAIPVLFSKMTVRNTGLKSPVGVIILKRTQKVALPGGGTSLPVNLRTGDRFKGSGTISDINKRTFYPRVPMNKDAVVYFRSKEMSLAELTAAVDALRKALGALQGQVNDLAKYTFAGFQQLLGEIDALKKQLASLNIPGAVDLSGLQSQIDDLKTQLNGVIDSLKDYAKLTDVDKKIADAIAGLSLLTNTDVTNTVNSILNSLSFDTTALSQFVDDTVTGLLGNPAGTLTTVVNGLIDDKITADVPGLISTAITNADLATNTDLDAATAKIDALTARLNSLCTKLNQPGVLAILGIANLNGACS
jgi:polyhydroxyalkanoate synthesis regulator phasin